MEFDEFVLAASLADLDGESAARPHADAVEFRMDLADEPLAALSAYDGELPVIATNRADWEGGAADGGEGPGDPANGDRIDALMDAVGYSAVEAVDVELASVNQGDGRRVIRHAHEHDAAAIVSVHDRGGTPPAAEMHALLGAAVNAGDVGKLAVTAADAGDVLDLLAATRTFATDGWTVATMAMGRPGRHSRAIAPIYGSRIGYAPVDADAATAPGQFDLATLRELVETLQ